MALLRSARALSASASRRVGTAQNIDWPALGFEYVRPAGLATATWKDGKWSPVTFTEDDTFRIHSMANVLHYGQALFEGLKAFARDERNVLVFRDRCNMARLNTGAARLCMPAVPEEIWTWAIDTAIRENAAFVPPHGSGSSLYLRPNYFGSGAQMGLGTSSEFTFNVVVSPVGSYYKNGMQAVRCKIMEDFDRAAPKGTGSIKAAGNYAADLKALTTTQQEGFPIGLYLDAKTGKHIEEFNTSNFVGIYTDKEGRKRYVTPAAPLTTLPSITNKALMQVAADAGLIVEERPIAVEELHRFDEIGAVGTAVVVTPLASVERAGKVLTDIKGFSTLDKLAEKLKCIQRGDEIDAHGWTRLIDVAM